MSGRVISCLGIGIMLILMIVRRRVYGIPIMKIIPMSPCVAGMGLLGTYILFFIENGFWYGKSFFGAVLFFPALLLPVSLLFRIPLNQLLSYSTPPGMTILAVFKYNCYLLGCCGGKVLWFSEEGVPTHFPSQIIEMIVAIIISIALMILERKVSMRNKIYPVCLVTYGLARVILNYFRWEQPNFILGIAPGTLWSVIAVCVGIIWLAVSSARENSKEENSGV